MKRDLEILVVESNRYHSVMLMKELAQRFPESILENARNGASALKAVSHRRFDIAILDFGDPLDMDGLQLMELIRQKDIDLPIIVLSAHESEQIASEAIKLGASEFVVKDSNFHHTIARLVGEVYRRRILVEKNRDLEAKLREKESTDLVKMTIGTLSHEVNNPLMTIMGLSELMITDDSVTDSELIKKVKIIRKSAERIKKTLIRLENITKPSIKQTAAGEIIDSRNSRARNPVSAKVKLTNKFS